MDILLTPEETEQALLFAALEKATPVITDRFLHEALCRAQVRKFHLWLMTHWQSAKKLDGAVQLTISEADWAALKAAGGEEK